ncbi:hypothetical protein [Streptomyces sp. NPDC048508]
MASMPRLDLVGDSEGEWTLGRAQAVRRPADFGLQRARRRGYC